MTVTDPDCQIKSFFRKINYPIGKTGFDFQQWMSGKKLTGERDNTGLVAKKLGIQKLVVCAAPDYPERSGIPKTPEDLKGRDCVTGWKKSG
ncbi:hypothetical protein A7K99_17395 [Tatumella citrea]|uniref:Uncharacterized protein n=1 Tax=Tatumella citrea TaxID=53336 RepID=A0A1Y0LN03_TATCI|nr:hypothetical protein A7K98_17410 [Tatumella citrea]ARU99401.1 hypothetical protein A7K99_17395 [Tatumella citrea]